MSRSFDGFDITLPTNAAGMTWHLNDNEDGTWTVGAEQDCSAILDNNHQRASTSDGWTPDKTFRHVASIPLVVLEDWKNMGVDWRDPDGAKEVITRLNSNEFYKLRTANVRGNL